MIALGLARYGHSDLAARLAATLFDAAAHMELRRLPELFCGMRRQRDKGPILYPVACSPQAWAAAAPFGMLQACLGLEIDATQRLARLRYPRLPERMDSLSVRGLPIGDATVDLLLRRHGEDVSVNILRRRRRGGDPHDATLKRAQSGNSSAICLCSFSVGNVFLAKPASSGSGVFEALSNSAIAVLRSMFTCSQ